MQRNFEPMRKQVEVWQKSELTDVTAKLVIYEAFVEGRLEAPKHLARTVHDLPFYDIRKKTFRVAVVRAQYRESRKSRVMSAGGLIACSRPSLAVCARLVAYQHAYRS